MISDSTKAIRFESRIKSPMVNKMTAITNAIYRYATVEENTVVYTRVWVFTFKIDPRIHGRIEHHF